MEEAAETAPETARRVWGGERMDIVIKRENGEVVVVVGDTVLRAKEVRVYQEDYPWYDEKDLPDVLAYDAKKAVIKVRGDALTINVFTD